MLGRCFAKVLRSMGEQHETSPPTFLHLAAGAAALPAVSRFAWAQAYPSRPVRIIVGSPPAAQPTSWRA